MRSLTVGVIKGLEELPFSRVLCHCVQEAECFTSLADVTSPGNEWFDQLKLGSASLVVREFALGVGGLIRSTGIPDYCSRPTKYAKAHWEICASPPYACH